MQPLEGVRVLDLTRALAGPFCTMMLGDLGADVVKVERPGRGDESRGWGPPFVGEPYGPYPGESAYFISTNRNKRSITVNLKSPEGQEIVRRLAAKSDAFVENFRTGVLDEMGLGYEDLSGVYPRLVYCSISGYGRTGPYADRPGYDLVIQAEGGFMGITGPEEGPPSRVGVPIIDITAGMFAATGILAALRARDVTGEGQLVDVSLLDTQVALLTNVASNHLVGGEGHRRLGNAHPNIAPYEAFPARDRWFVLAAGNERLWATLCDLLDRPDLKDDPRFADNNARVANRPALWPDQHHSRRLCPSPGTGAGSDPGGRAPGSGRGPVLRVSLQAVAHAGRRAPSTTTVGPAHRGGAGGVVGLFGWRCRSSTGAWDCLMDDGGMRSTNGREYDPVSAWLCVFGTGYQSPVLQREVWSAAPRGVSGH
jgi:crotonobetainyl-CoA:carnitine CoA-transferase CaiB-like acyl-CoA transferase